jgi:diguanylate cyclase (GGDEF)-like protein/PAS domain S-box-containing protein
MGLRLKLIVPALVLLAAVTALVHFYWLPNYLNSEIEQQLDHERAYIKLLGDILTADLLSNDLSETHGTLDRVLASRSGWHAIKLFKFGELRIYPLYDEPLPDGIDLIPVHHPIQFKDQTIATLTVWIDIQSSTAEQIEHIRYLEQLLLSLLLGVSLIALIFQDRWIRIPLKQLASLAKDASYGNYDTKLEYKSQDEVGNLVESFNVMREQISQREQKLKYYSNLQTMIRRAQDKFIRNIDDENVFTNLQQQILELTNSKQGFISEVLHDDNDKPYLRTFSASNVFITGHDDDNDRNEKGKGIEFHDHESLPGKVLATNRPVIINTTEDKDDTTLVGVKNYLGLPISSGNKLIGVVGVANSKAGYSPSLYDDLQVLLVTLASLIIAYRENKALQESESRFRAVVDNAADGIITINTLGIILGCNRAAEEIFGYPINKMMGQNINMLMPEPYKSEHDGYLHKYLMTGEKHIMGIGRELEGLRGDGTVFPLDLAVSEIRTGGDLMYMGIIRDISARVYADREKLRYSKSLEQLHEITSNSELNFQQKVNALLKLGQEVFILPLAIVSHVVGERYIVEHISGPEGAPTPGTEYLLGETYCCHTLTANGPTGFDHVGESDIGNHPCYINFGLESYIGVPLLVSDERYGTLNFSSPDIRKEPFTSIDYSLIQLFAQWIGNEMARERAAAELEQAYTNVNKANTKLEELSRTDSLTGVANRRYFDEVLSQELNRTLRHNSPLTLIICDIDYFKNYNDTYGHQAGDHCLRKVTSAIESSFSRAGELVARYGGEEFAVIIPNINKEKGTDLAENMRNNVVELNLTHETSRIADHVTISVGITTLIPDQNTTMSLLVEQADTALYKAKKNGRNNVQHYHHTGLQ